VSQEGDLVWAEVSGGEVLRGAAKEEALPQHLEVATGVELIIAAVKGVRQLPDQAEDVLAQLHGLLTGKRPTGR